MATIEDLNVSKFSEMSKEEAIELLRQIRLSRRVPVKPTKKKKAPKAKILSQKDAQDLLKLLEG